MRRVGLAAIIAGLVIAGAIGAAAAFIHGAGEAERVVAPTRTPTSPAPAPLSPPGFPAAPAPTATPTPLPTLEPTSGTVVYLRGNDLWVASLDGGQTLPPRAITHDSLDTRYAGYVRRPDGGIDLYYVEQLTEPAEGDYTETAEFGVYRVPLERGAPEELLLLYSRELLFIGDYSSRSDASVSPDGRHIMYADAEGLALHDLASGQSTRLLTNNRCTANVDGCYAYQGPHWSPQGEQVLVDRLPYEGVEQIILRPLAAPIEVIETGRGGSSEWAPDGERLCVVEGVGHGDGQAHVYTVASGEDTVLTLPVPTPELRRPLPLAGCTWSSGGMLAIGVRGASREPGWVTVLNPDLSPRETSTAIEEFGYVVAWLPDGSGVVFNRMDERPEPHRPGIYHLERGPLDLPFEADEALGVIP